MALLKEISYYKTGGPCRNFFAPKSCDELQENFRQILREKLPYFLMGEGSNSLVSDEPWHGAVVYFGNLKHLEVRGHTVVAEAGVNNTDFSILAMQNNLAGAAFMYSLPGFIGATTRMNAKCYGGEMSQIIRKVHFLDEHAEYKMIESPVDSEEVFKGYKNTIFMQKPYIIWRVEAELQIVADNTQIKDKMEQCKKDRDDKGHFDFPSCGCVFKNDYKAGVSSGFLLELAGCKSLKVGGAEVNPRHANFIYNKGHATSRDILQLSFQMQELVYKKFGIFLQYEMEFLGSESPELMTRFRETRLQDYHNKSLLAAKKQFAQKLVTVTSR